ncbi:MAG: hypothetical protein EOM87_05475, partial [Clostridia bacterium]|nr:hypothetical protein [Clostridia bacterium]
MYSLFRHLLSILVLWLTLCHFVVNIIDKFYLPKNAEEFFDSKYDYVIDAIDTVTAKLDLAVRCYQNNIPIISCMGTGNKLDASLFEVCDINKTQTCP